ncbi:RsmE family RNA methyltransferase, partial [uncultured Hyphomonas sp.]|uniref:RsmE family RNA methyltransferase n=1 Tax=uncultured Hyphomonas sp. TaxID=225298 RepID=UPI0026227643
MSSIPRLFVSALLEPSVPLRLEEDASKYLMRVMRLAAGDEVRVFNGRDGEWSAKLVPESAKKASLEPVRQTRAQVEVPDLTLLFAPLKKARTDFVVEKACELGVRQIQPVMTEWTQASRVRTDRLQATVIEAAEQTERMDIPVVLEDMPLAKALDTWDSGVPLY